MSQPTPRDRIEAAIAAGEVPPGTSVSDLRRTFGHWERWCGEAGHDPARLTPEAASAWLAALRTKMPCERSAFATFAMFQTTASLVWGVEDAACLARVLRVRVSRKAPAADRWDRARRAVRGLPDLWQPPFEALLRRSADPRTMRAAQGTIWSAARIENVACAARRYHDVVLGQQRDPIPAAGLFAAWAEALLARGVSPLSIGTYLDRVIAAFETVLTPGTVYDGAAAIADRWAARGKAAERRKAKARYVMPASEIHDLGHAMMAEAEASPVRRLTETLLYRDGLLLAVASALPERARALSVLEYDVTLFLEPAGIIRIAIPGSALKQLEARKHRNSYHTRFRNPRLHRALTVWRSTFRPLVDDGGWLWPSKLDREHGLTEARIGQICGDVTERRLGRRVPLHGIRDCVATEIVETDPVHGPARATGTLRHRDPAVTEEHYIRSDGRVAALAWDEAVTRRAGKARLRLDL